MAVSRTRRKSAYSLAEAADLAPLTTFGVAARAACLATLHETGALPGLLGEPRVAAARERLVLGAGSNVLFTRDFPGVVLRVATRGIEAVAESPGGVRVRVAAGENWDALVRWSLRRRLAGLENLIFIPGSVGAAPVQNIGAYGVELAEFVTAVQAWDFESGASVTLTGAECAFAYRDSCFKRAPDRYLVTCVELELPRERPLRMDYAGVGDELRAAGVSTPGHADVARAVERLRRRKLPDPAALGNAGSFFKNPVVDASEAAAVRSEHPALRAYAHGGRRVKLSAAGLIEACGFRGWRAGRAGVSDQHALVLVNYGGASGAELWALAERIRDTVRARFGIALEPEPRVL